MLHSQAVTAMHTLPPTSPPRHLGHAHDTPATRPRHLTPATRPRHACGSARRWIHTWSGHTKGVAAIRWFPGNGHLLLSAGMDHKVKIWDVFNTRKCVQTYMGHAAAVRDIQFTNDGKRFLTCSYDRYLKLWDTETGQCISAFTNRKLPYCCTFNPDDDKQHVFLAGCSNKHIVQYDTHTGKVEQLYDQHLAAVRSAARPAGPSASRPVRRALRRP